MRLHWILVDGEGVRGLGTFEGTEVEVLVHLEHGPAALSTATNGRE